MATARVTANPLAPKRAIEHFKARVPMTREAFDKLGEQHRNKAFYVSEVAQASVIADVFSALQDALANGLTLDEFQDAIGEQLRASWGVENPWRLETIFRTNIQTAYSAGRYRALSDPDVVGDRPFWLYDAVMDSRTSEICKHLDGTILPASDPFWNDHTPPCHFNCRAQLIALTEEQAERMGGVSKAPPVKPDGSFGAPPGLGFDWKPDVTDFPPEIAQALGAKLKKAL